MSHRLRQLAAHCCLMGSPAAPKRSHRLDLVYRRHRLCNEALLGGKDEHTPKQAEHCITRRDTSPTPHADAGEANCKQKKRPPKGGLKKEKRREEFGESDSSSRTHIRNGGILRIIEGYDFPSVLLRDQLT